MPSSSPLEITVNLRIAVDGRRDIPRWRLKVIGLAARLLRVPLSIAAINDAQEYYGHRSPPAPPASRDPGVEC